MSNLFYHILFFIFSIYALIKCIFYGIYEINTENNKIRWDCYYCFFHFGGNLFEYSSANKIIF